jgi:O-antigen ligase
MFAEATVAYVVTVNALTGLRTHQLFARAGGLVALLIAGSLLSLLQVPGFGPETPPNVATGGPEHIAYLTTYYARLSNPFYGLSNDYASVLALYVLPLLAWGVVSRKTSYSLLAGTAFAGVALTLSRGVVIATVAGGILFLSAERRRVTRWIPGIVLGGGLVAATGYLYYRLNEAVQTHLLDRLTATTIQVREAILTRTLQQVAESPLLGYGGGVVTDPLLADGVHNTYLQQVLYYGIPLGVVCSAALWLLAARLLLWPVRTRAARVMAAAIGVSVFIQLAVFLVETSFEATLPKTALYFFVAFGVIVVMQVDREEPTFVSTAADARAPR